MLYPRDPANAVPVIFKGPATFPHWLGLTTLLYSLALSHKAVLNVLLSVWFTLTVTALFSYSLLYMYNLAKFQTQLITNIQCRFLL